MALEIVVGPMFSGKTTYIIETYNKLNKKIDENYNSCLAIDFSDKPHRKGFIISHSGDSIECINCNKLYTLCNDIENRIEFLKADYIFINEAQFFEDLKEWVLFTLKTFNKKIFIVGLELDFKRKIFGQIHSLKPYSRMILNLKGKCSLCNFQSEYSHRISDNYEQILMDCNQYIPLCRKCWEEKNPEKIKFIHHIEFNNNIYNNVDIIMGMKC